MLKLVPHAVFLRKGCDRVNSVTIGNFLFSLDWGLIIPITFLFPCLLRIRNIRRTWVFNCLRLGIEKQTMLRLPVQL